MEIGSHCFFTGCNRLDFLPIKCPLCKNFFCKDHSLPSVHDCPFQNLNEEATLKLEEKIPIEKEICFIGGCQIAGVKIKCDKCRRLFCLQHRLPEQHDCPVLKHEQNLAKENLAKEKAATISRNENVQNLIPAEILKNKGKQPVKKKKLSEKDRIRAAKIRCMKLRSTAKGPSKVFS